MKNFIFLVLMLATAFALPGKEIRSRNLVVPAGQPEGRIVGGYYATKSQFPYQAALILDETDNGYKLCGGSMLSNEWILTAAHCIRNVSKVKVLLGVTDIENPARKSMVQYMVGNESFIIHKTFRREINANDIALIQIPFTKYTDRIKPVKLPAMGQNVFDYVGAKVIASGWGNIGNLPTHTTEQLRWVDLDIIPNIYCNEFFEKPLLSSHICTANLNGTNICDGDSGGPLVLAADKTLIGIISFTSENCLDGHPGVYTRVDGSLKWIKDITNVS